MKMVDMFKIVWRTYKYTYEYIPIDFLLFCEYAVRCVCAAYSFMICCRSAVNFTFDRQVIYTKKLLYRTYMHTHIQTADKIMLLGWFLYIL